MGAGTTHMNDALSGCANRIGDLPMITAKALLILLAVAGAVLGLGACANPRADAAIGAQTALIGMTRADLVSCAGVPTGVLATGSGEEVLTYESRQGAAYGSGASVGFGAYGGNFGYGLGFPVGPSYVEETRTCRASFTLRNNVVSRVVYGGADNNYGDRLTQCYQIVENCIPRPLP